MSKIEYLFEGTYTVAADDRNEAHTMVTRDCGLVLGGDIHTTLDDDEVNWDSDVPPDIQIISYTESNMNEKLHGQNRDTPQRHHRCHTAVALLTRTDRDNLPRRTGGSCLGNMV